MLKYRLIFGPIMLAALALVFHLDNSLDRIDLTGTFIHDIYPHRAYLPAGLVMLAMFLVLIVLAARELTTIFRAKGVQASTPIVTISALAGCLLLYCVRSDTSSQTTLAIFGTIVCLIFIASMVQYSWLHKRTQGAVLVSGVTLLAMIYLGVLPGFYIAIRRWHSAWIVAAILVTTKSSDIGAYFTGRAFGKHKLIPWLSPGKTWEGLLGGAVFSAIVGVLLAAALNHSGVVGVYSESGKHAPALVAPADGMAPAPQAHVPQPREFKPFTIPLAAAAATGFLFALVGQFGDLTASLFKRDAGIKDSGSSIPGFGGILDVLDSPIIIAPLAYWLLFLAKKLAL